MNGSGGAGAISRRRVAVATLVIAWVAAAALGQTRVVAVGDVHGSIDGLVGILQESGLVDHDAHWIGGDAVLVQTGDLLDRGVHLDDVMDLMMRLQTEAAAAGGRVVVLLGNHEMMNLIGIHRDVNKDAYARFANDESEERRRDGYAAFKRFFRARTRELGQPSGTFPREVEEQWMALYPPGALEYQAALMPEGRYGRWLRSLPTTVVIDDTLFIHGGYSPHLAGLTPDEVNSHVGAEIEAYDELRSFMVSEGIAPDTAGIYDLVAEAKKERDFVDDAIARGRDVDTARRQRLARLEALETWGDWLLVHPDGPAWWRGAANWDDSERAADMAALLDGVGVTRMVAGHTPQKTRAIQPRFADRVFLIDTGMLTSVYRGRASALEITDGTVVAVYIGERETLVEADDAGLTEEEPEVAATADAV